MNASTPVEKIDALLGPGASPSLHRVDELDRFANSLGEQPGVIGEVLREFRRALGVLKMKHAAGDADSIELASMRVREMWATLAPALRKLATVENQRAAAY